MRRESVPKIASPNHRHGVYHTGNGRNDPSIAMEEPKDHGRRDYRQVGPSPKIHRFELRRDESTKQVTTKREFLGQWYGAYRRKGSQGKPGHASRGGHTCETRADTVIGVCASLEGIQRTNTGPPASTGNQPGLQR